MNSDSSISGSPIFHSFCWRAHWLEGAFVFVLLIAIYLASAPPGVTFEDTGLFTTNCYTGRFAHPPGYPLYSLLCQPFAWLDALPSPALSVAFFSMVTAAACAVASVEIAYRISGERWIAILCAILLGIAARFWGQAILPEVYSLNALLTMLCLLVIFRYLHQPRPALLSLLALLGGLGLSNHWPLFLIVSPGFLLLLAPHWRGVLRALTTPRIGISCVLLFIVGLSPYLYLFTATPEPIFFSTIIDDIPTFVDYVSRDAYTDRDAYTTWDNRIALAGAALYFALTEFTVLGMIPIFLGGVALARRSVTVLLAVFWGGIGAFCALGAIVGFADDLTGRSAFSAYFSPVACFLIIAVAGGLAWLQQVVRPSLFRGITLLLLLWVFIVNVTFNYRADDDLAEGYSRSVYQLLPKDATLLVSSDIAFPLLYYYRLIDARADIKTIGVNQLDLEDDYTAEALVVQLRAHAQNPETIVALFPPTEEIAFTFHGLFNRLHLDDAEISAMITPAFTQFLRQALDLRHYDSNGANILFRKYILAEAAKTFAVYRRHFPDAPLDEADSELEAMIFDTPSGLYGEFVARVLGLGRELSTKQFHAKLGLLEENFHQLPNGWQAQILQIKATEILLSARTPNHVSRAVAVLRESIALHPHDENPAIVDLLQIHGEQEQWLDYKTLRGRFEVDNDSLTRYDESCRRALFHSCVAL